MHKRNCWPHLTVLWTAHMTQKNLPLLNTGDRHLFLIDMLNMKKKLTHFEKVCGLHSARKSILNASFLFLFQNPNFQFPKWLNAASQHHSWNTLNTAHKEKQNSCLCHTPWKLYLKKSPNKLVTELATVRPQMRLKKFRELKYTFPIMSVNPT